MSLSDNRIFHYAHTSLYKTGMLLLVMFLSVPAGALAVTGQAERLDEVKEADLKEFQQALIEEEQLRGTPTGPTRPGFTGNMRMDGKDI